MNFQRSIFSGRGWAAGGANEAKPVVQPRVGQAPEPRHGLATGVAARGPQQCARSVDLALTQLALEVPADDVPQARAYNEPSHC